MCETFFFIAIISVKVMCERVVWETCLGVPKCYTQHSESRISINYLIRSLIKYVTIEEYYFQGKDFNQSRILKLNAVFH